VHSPRRRAAAAPPGAEQRDDGRRQSESIAARARGERRVSGQCETTRGGEEKRSEGSSK
jgi:hypothetical protein